MTTHTLDEAMERLRKNHYPLWRVMVEVREDPAMVAEWRQAPEDSSEWRKARQHEQALWVPQESLND